MKICFFVRLKDPALFNLVGFYKADIDSLRALGHEVTLVNRLRDLLTNRCDLYFAWWFGFGFFPMVLARVLGKPSILVGAVHTGEGGGLDDSPWIKRILMKAAMKLAGRTLFISHTDQRKLGGFTPREGAVVYCALNLERNAPGNVTKRDWVVAVTHLTKENVRRKMLLESLEVFAGFLKTNPGYEFHVCGSFGDGLESVREKCRSLNVEKSVVLRGRVTESEKTELLRQARIYLQPSLCEGFGLAILEAQACGTPVVTNREPCIVEISGDSVTYGDAVEELQGAMQRLVTDPVYYAEMRRRGLANVLRYSTTQRQVALARTIAGLCGTLAPHAADSSPTR